MKSSLDLLILYSLAFTGFCIAKKLKVPTPSLLGPLMLIGGLKLLGIVLPSPPYWFASGTQILLGILIGLRFRKEDIPIIKKNGFALVLIGLWALIITFSLGYFINKILPVDIETAIMSASPGGLPEMTILAAATNADLPLVVFAHTARLVGTILFIPLVLKTRTKSSHMIAGTEQEEGKKSTLLNIKLNELKNLLNVKLISRTIIIAVSGALTGYLANKANIPAGYLVGSLVAVSVIALFGLHPGRPNPVFHSFLLLSVGIMVSNNFVLSHDVSFSYYIIPCFVALIYIFSGSLLMALLIRKITGYDLNYCLILAAPAGVTAMSALAMDLEYDPIQVSVYHLTRLMTLKILIPLYFMKIY